MSDTTPTPEPQYPPRHESAQDAQPQFQQTYQQAYQQAPQQPLPVQPLLESEARTYSMLIHLIAGIGAVVSAGFLGFVAPLVIWLIFRQRSALVDFHGKQQLNLQITGFIVAAAAVVLGIVTIGFGFLLTLPLWIAFWIYSIIVSFIACTKANAGEYYPIRFAIPFLK